MGMLDRLLKARSLAWARIRWAAEPRLFWFTVAVVGVAVYFSMRCGATERDVRIVAMALQLLGVVQVAVGVRQTRKLFNHPGIADWTRAWWGRRPKGSVRIGVLAGDIHMGGFNATGTMSAQFDRSKTASLEDRVGRLERESEILIERVTETNEEIARVKDDHHKKLEGEARVREEADAANRKLVESTQTGGLALSAAGAVWLAVGIILGSFPAEIAGIAGW